MIEFNPEFCKRYFLTEEEVNNVTNIVEDPTGNGIPKWFLNR